MAKKINMELSTQEIYTILQGLQRQKTNQQGIDIPWPKSSLTTEQLDELINKFGRYSVQWQMEKISVFDDGNPVNGREEA